MLGLVLCGGLSTRMGTDKGLLKLQQNTWAQTAIDKLSILKIPVALSINSSQQESYKMIFTNHSLIVDNADIPLKGPLLGVLSAHCQFPEEDLLVLACDMPLMNEEVIGQLFLHAAQNAHKEAIVFTSDEQPEPLCAIYRAKPLSQILKMVFQEMLHKSSMKNMIQQLDALFIPLSYENKSAFRNFNANTALNGL